MGTRKWIIEFSWLGLNDKNEIQQGKTIVSTQGELINLLTKHNITLLKITHKKYLYQSLSLSSKQLATFCNQLANLLMAGIPILESLSLIKQHSPSQLFTSALTKIHESLNQGNSIANAFKAYPELFPASFQQMLHVGEQTGRLTEIFSHLGEFYNKQFAIQQRIKQALWYPTIVIITALGVAIILLDIVIPQLAALFLGMSSQLPWITRTVISVSQFFQQWQSLFFISSVSTVLYVVYYQPKLNLLRRLLTQMPLLKTVVMLNHLLTLLHTLEITYCTGLPIINTFEILEHTATDPLWRKQIDQIQTDLKNGMGLTQALINVDDFPDLMLQSIQIGETTGRLDAILGWLTVYYQKELNQMIDRLLALLEPTVILLLGAFIGIILIALYLPLFKMASLI